MSRNYDLRRIKRNRVYSVSELKALFNVSENTVSNWVGQGLTPSDRRKPHVFRGLRVEQFHRDRRNRSKGQLRFGEFKCTVCGQAVLPERQNVVVHSSANRNPMLESGCPECGARIYKISSNEETSYFLSQTGPNTPRQCAREGNSRVPGRIGKSNKESASNWYTANDRIVHAYQSYCGRYDPKTTDQHLAAIRYAEQVTSGLPFSKYTRETVDGIREDLKASLSGKSEPRLANSTVAHKASQLSAFYSWLIGQDGFDHLPRDLSAYMVLPRSAYAAALPPTKREFPTMAESEQMLEAMPSGTLAEGRDRAIFAVANLGGLRADTVVSLRIGSIDPENGIIIQDARVSRAKKGKSLRVKWFPLKRIFSEVAIQWVERLIALGFKDEDALFPRLEYLKNAELVQVPGRDPIEPMSTTHAVTKAFEVASQGVAKQYTPHSVKHVLAAEGDARMMTREQSKAWSENLGHDNEATTARYYGKLTEERRFELIDNISEKGSTSLRQLSDQEKIALVDEVVAKVTSSRN